MELGELELTRVSDGGFRLDGGAMFGVVPRVLWEKGSPPDEQNRIRMGTNCLLVARGSDLLLIDTGIGDKHDAKFRETYAMDPDAVRLPESIRRAGYELGDVTHVLLSHLHFDHCGWNTRESGGQIVPTFPKACYWLQRGEVEHARLPNERDRGSYFPDNWEPLFEAGVVELFGDEAEPFPGVKAVRVPGHNANMCIVVMDGGDGAQAVYWADLVPRASHVPYAWIMSYDLYPLTTLENKKIWLPRAAEGNWLCAFEHDPDMPFGRLVEEKPGRYRAVPVEVPEAQSART
ncbi:MAG TPA: MBL fold metallo-hydrolase [Thermoanaerobaculia bacterium]|jgi:glyoxylase-like metal-dependent hydrolase (beta-lactamase superfamily II)